MITREDLRTDEGLTLSELLVVVSLLGVVMAAGWGAFAALRQSGDVASRQARFAQEVSYPLLTMERTIIQNRELMVGSDAYTLIFTTDENLDGQFELYTIRATEQGALHLLKQLTNDSGQVVSTVANYDLSDANTNNVTDAYNPEKRPMFRYFAAPDENGVIAEISPDSQDLTDDTRSIQLTVRSTYMGKNIEESRTIQFRNRD